MPVKGRDEPDSSSQGLNFVVGWKGHGAWTPAVPDKLPGPPSGSRTADPSSAPGKVLDAGGHPASHERLTFRLSSLRSPSPCLRYIPCLSVISCLCPPSLVLLCRAPARALSDTTATTDHVWDQMLLGLFWKPIYMPNN